MKMKPGLVLLLGAIAFGSAVACGGDSDKGGVSASGGVVSCDIQQGGLHYCEEAPGSPGTDTGCPTMMAGYTPGTGCSRTGLSGTCTANGYKFFIYTTGVAASTLASICPGGTFEPATLDGGVDISAGGAPATSSDGACAELAACCNSSGDATLKSTCLDVYKSTVKSGDKTCAGFLPLYKLALSCP